MIKRYLAIALSTLLLLPALVYAVNMQVTSSCAPVAGGSISPLGFKSTPTFVTYSVTTRAGYSRTNVKIDSSTVASDLGHNNKYTVPFTAGAVKKIVANFAPITYTIGTSATTGGQIQVMGGGLVNIPPIGAKRTIIAAPLTGYQIASFTVDDVPIDGAAGSTVAVPVVFDPVTANHTIVASFSTMPTATVYAGSDKTVVGTPTFSTGLAGSVNANQAATYQWAQTTGPNNEANPSGASFANGTTLTPTFAGTSLGTYYVKLTATVGGTPFVSARATINVQGPIANNACMGCHAGNQAVKLGLNCTVCHSDTQHAAFIKNSTPAPGNRCIDCHAFNQNAGAGYVQDNNGIRAITTEFTKWSHHVTGVTLQDAHCAACHLEGKVQGASILVDHQYHMSDAKTHLRNADTDADMAWDPSAPNHTLMDNFCMSCHDANGATSDASIAIQAVIVPATGKTASATNPFGDTISNRYDKMQRPAVVDASSQFDATNNSHHAVKLNKYSGRTRSAGSRQIASAATFAANSSATLYGARSTIYDAGNFNALYTPLENTGGEAAPRTGAATLGDDSTLHCGDCHTVGQWKVGSSTNADGTATTIAIGAHGSNNEYLLRNSIGTDARHTQNAYTVTAVTNAVVTTNPNGAFLVCFNCHAFNKYGSAFNATGATGPHAGEYASAGRCNGPGNTLSFNGYTSGAATDGTQFDTRFTMNPSTIPAVGYAGEQKPEFGNVYGIQCANCHNSGVENGYGGIHGSKVNTYTDGMGMTNKMIHFLPGLGNSKYVPGTLGGFSGTTQHNYSSATSKKYSVIGDVSNDTNWEQKQSKPNQGTPGQATDATGAVIQRGAGCYTLSPTATAATFDQKGLSVDGGATIPEALETWGGCDDHGAAVGAGDHGTYKKIVRPVTY